MKNLVIGLSFVVAACGGTTASPEDAAPAQADAGFVDSAAPDAAADAPVDSSTVDAAATCGFVGSTGPLVQASATTATMPKATGGIIADGTYVLDAVTYYEAASAPQETWSATIEIHGTAYTLGTTRNGKTAYESGTTMAQASQVTISTVCPTSASHVIELAVSSGSTDFTFYATKDERALHFVKKI